MAPKHPQEDTESSLPPSQRIRVDDDAPVRFMRRLYLSMARLSDGLLIKYTSFTPPSDNAIPKISVARSPLPASTNQSDSSTIQPEHIHATALSFWRARCHIRDKYFDTKDSRHISQREAEKALAPEIIEYLSGWKSARTGLDETERARQESCDVHISSEGESFMAFQATTTSDMPELEASAELKQEAFEVAQLVALFKLTSAGEARSYAAALAKVINSKFSGKPLTFVRDFRESFVSNAWQEMLAYRHNGGKVVKGFHPSQKFRLFNRARGEVGALFDIDIDSVPPVFSWEENQCVSWFAAEVVLWSITAIDKHHLPFGFDAAGILGFFVGQVLALQCNTQLGGFFLRKFDDALLNRSRQRKDQKNKREVEEGGPCEQAQGAGLSSDLMDDIGLNVFRFDDPTAKKCRIWDVLAMDVERRNGYIPDRSLKPSTKDAATQIPGDVAVQLSPSLFPTIDYSSPSHPCIPPTPSQQANVQSQAVYTRSTRAYDFNSLEQRCQQPDLDILVAVQCVWWNQYLIKPNGGTLKQYADAFAELLTEEIMLYLDKEGCITFHQCFVEGIADELLFWAKQVRWKPATSPSTQNDSRGFTDEDLKLPNRTKLHEVQKNKLKKVIQRVLKVVVHDPEMLKLEACYLGRCLTAAMRDSELELAEVRIFILIMEGMICHYVRIRYPDVGPPNYPPYIV